MDYELYVPVTDLTEVGQARREISALGRRLGFDDTDVGKVAIVVTELGSNLVKHAGGGELLARALPDGARAGMQIMAVDHGPGIPDQAMSLQDGYSTAGTRGTGLGAVSRLSSYFDIYSVPGSGSTQLVELWPGPRKTGRAALAFDVGVLSAPKGGEEVSGDSWASAQSGQGANFILADGLGHGLGAAEASQEAVEVFDAHSNSKPAEILALVHGALKKTRGAAVAIAAVDLEKQIVSYAGVGNVSGVIVSEAGRRSLISHNGTAGHEARKIQEFTYPWTGDSILVMHTDGVATHWDLSRYPGLLDRRASIIAGRIYSDFTRRRDDAAILVAKKNQL